ncbi:hypothetical protein NIES593_22915 [Hydrococcus rivularis NIES-593]|uniref:Uncharacterized protein n=1 Tax=Hydrococcus rivularis NIES-593 TaxID=1921803 RepID=A0A1U7H6S6_9CYAN|nr:hypothetical protein [Hydrococcus rivularis]OKH17633.1 hypothetical protein NIES593_22915 [Hydrococcus rivularis NIES-593]
MNAKESARELMTQKRQQEEHLHETMLNRSQEELETANTAEIEEQARELMAQQRQQEEHVEESMLSRAEAEIHASKG